MDYLVLLADALARDPTLAVGIRYTPNSSFYHSADGWRYVETRLQDKRRSHHLVALEDDEAIAVTLERAREGATRASLAAALVDEDVSEEEADAFVGDLIGSQILIPDFECPVTGPGSTSGESSVRMLHSGDSWPRSSEPSGWNWSACSRPD